MIIKTLSSHKYNERGFSPLFIVLAIGLFAIIGFLGYQKLIHKNTETQNTTQKTNTSVAMPTSPKLDYKRIRVVTAKANEKTVIQTLNRQNVLISLEIPAGALDKDQKIILTPFLSESQDQASSVKDGVYLSPTNLTFKKPVNLAFIFSKSTEKNDAPEKFDLKKGLSFSKSQIVLLNEKANTTTPVLINRAEESNIQLPARILSGGYYFYDLSGQNKVTIAEKSFEQKQTSLVTLEATLDLLFNQKQLTPKQKTIAEGAVNKIMDKKSPSGPELLAAVMVDKQLNKKTGFSFVKEAFARGVSDGYIESVCKDSRTIYEDLMSMTATAQLLGFDDIADKCLIAANNKIVEEAKTMLRDPNVDKQVVLQMLADVQYQVNDSGLEQQLNQKIIDQFSKEITDNGAKNVVPFANINPPRGSLEYEIDETAVGIAIAQAFGLKSFDETGLKDFNAQMRKEADRLMEETKGACDGFDELMSAEGMREIAAELNATDLMHKAEDNCHNDVQSGKLEQEMDQIFDQADQEAEKIGEIQSQDWETPEYTEDGGDPEVGIGNFFESPSPEPENNEIDPDSREDNHERPDESSEEYVNNEESD